MYVKCNKSQTLSVRHQDKCIHKISSKYLKRQLRKVRKTNFEQRAITHVKLSQTRQKSKLICKTSRQMHTQNFK